jgi:predicted nucleic acid-binding Zn ribbon protein
MRLNMPLPNHCTDCDKPIVNLDTSNLCDECYDTLSEESKSTADEFNDYYKEAEKKEC